jgi:hypothetical protein
MKSVKNKKKIKKKQDKVKMGGASFRNLLSWFSSITTESGNAPGGPSHGKPA